MKTGPEAASYRRGYVTLSDSKYHYYLKETIKGNNRVVISQSGTVKRRTITIPSAGRLQVQVMFSPQNYNSKELDSKKGLNWYELRGKGIMMRRWEGLRTNDRFAEVLFPMSPYQYGANNPVNNIDVNGIQLL